MRRLAPVLLLTAALGCSQPSSPAPTATTAKPSGGEAAAQAAQEVTTQNPAAPAKEMIDEIKEEIKEEIAREEQEEEMMRVRGREAP